jgi:hypothetical protein
LYLNKKQKNSALDRFFLASEEIYYVLSREMREFVEEVDEYNAKYREIFEKLIEKTGIAIREVFEEANVF